MIALTVFLGVSTLPASSQALSEPQKKVVTSWIAQHPGYRLANDNDCKCDEDLHTIRKTGYGGRWKPVPDYHPYVAIGDFNGDGNTDFAVALIFNNSPNRFAILVFNGPFDSANITPAYFDHDLKMRGIGFFFGPPRPKPYRLVIGAFESEGYLLLPKGQTYQIQSISSENE
jgi:hypothetical protein